MSDASLPLADGKHERFARLWARGEVPVEVAFREAMGARRGAKALAALQADPGVRARLAFLQEEGRSEAESAAELVAPAQAGRSGREVGGALEAAALSSPSTAASTGPSVSARPVPATSRKASTASSSAASASAGMSLPSRRGVVGEVLTLVEKRQICAEIARHAEKESERLQAIKVDNDLACEGAEAAREAAVFVVRIGGLDLAAVRAGADRGAVSTSTSMLDQDGRVGEVEREFQRELVRVGADGDDDGGSGGVDEGAWTGVALGRPSA